MQVKMTKVGTLNENCYVVSENGNCIIIDPGDEFLKIKKTINTDRVIAILLTHHHSDHIGAISDIVKYYGCPVYDNTNLEEKKYDFLGMKIEVIKTPGHTSDSLTYHFYEYGLMFVGDFIFKGTIGRTDLDTGSIIDMQNSILKLKNYSIRTKIYPGHESFTTLADEIRTNPYLRSLK